MITYCNGCFCTRSKVSELHYLMKLLTHCIDGTKLIDFSLQLILGVGFYNLLNTSVISYLRVLKYLRFHHQTFDQPGKGRNSSSSSLLPLLEGQMTTESTIAPNPRCLRI